MDITFLLSYRFFGVRSFVVRKRKALLLMPFVICKYSYTLGIGTSRRTFEGLPCIEQKCRSSRFVQSVHPNVY